MRSQKRLSLFQHIFLIWCLIVLFPLIIFTVLLSLVTYVIVYLISCFFPNYGKFISYTDVFLDEDFVNSVPQSSLIISLTLQGDLSFDELKSTFGKNVLNAHFSKNFKQLRYPELQQYLTTFMCFRVWKKDPNFTIQNHIIEKTWDESTLENIHQEYQNKPFEKTRSPWEMILIRNFNSNYNNESVQTSLLIFRVAHVMADAKSLLKLLVEDLGSKPLKTAIPQNIPNSNWDEVRFLLSFPWNFTHQIYKIFVLTYQSFHHPWKLHAMFSKNNYEPSKTIVSFSPKISLENVKKVAKQNDVKTSAVVMSIISGAIRKQSVGKWDKDVIVGYALPKPNHPEELTNHMYGGIMCSPTKEHCMLKRLQQCNQEFVRVKEEQQVRYTNILGLVGGVQVYPINRLAVNAFLPTNITNNAGEEEGFCVGDAECVDYCMTVGTLRGVAGVVFCTISYKDGVQIAVIGKEEILSKENLDSLGNDIELELQLLLKNS